MHPICCVVVAAFVVVYIHAFRFLPSLILLLPAKPPVAVARLEERRVVCRVCSASSAVQPLLRCS